MAAKPAAPAKTAKPAVPAKTAAPAGRGKAGVPGKAAGSTRPPRMLGRVFNNFWPRLDGSSRPSNGSSYYLIVGATLALTCIGLMTVLSASAAESISQDEDPYGLFLKEGMFAVIGLVAMFLLSRASVTFLKKIAYPAIFLAIALLALVFTPIGKEVGGNRNWIEIGSFSAQPSEAAKLALAVWMAAVLSRKGELVKDWKHALVPVVFPVALAILGLVLGGKDLGTAVIIASIVGAGLYFGGVRLRLFVPAILVAGVGALVFAATSGNRTSRLSGWLGNCDTGNDICYQAKNGIYALASGGWFGVGVGQSRQKWSWIPEAHNDFIFAIIGEEFGLMGTLLIVLLYGVLAFAIFRVIVRHNDTFVRIVCGCIMTWIIGQAFVNIAMVTGLLPVIGVPLPFISYGGSSLLLVLAAIGVVLSFARSYPESDTPAP
ncbi:putative lipid II flippase FtsW [Arthrobacter sp. 35W]|uniref:putative lipid II flippase FtsW n=1 Tax=Arthrobacter sp. 35W TaxID=1132441 RepID=UPI0004004F0C|nr:putative lipid II flippase FtsW [Arthrobacter sp. 35W]